MAVTLTRASIISAMFFIAAPPIVFYSILLSHIVNLPMFDDYYALLDFLNRLTYAPTFPAKARCFLSSQNNEYKLFFEHALSWMQLALWRHVDLTVLSILGDSFVLWLAILLWKMFRPRDANLLTRLVFFIPVSWLLFQLQYAQTLNFAMAVLQNLPVLVFSLATIYLLLRTSKWTFCGALTCLVLALSSSGNGLFMIPIGALILALRRNHARLSVWVSVSAICLVAYFYGYDTGRWLISHNSSPSMATFWRLPFFAIGFLGGIAGYPFKAGSLVLGVVICVFYAYVARCGYFRKDSVIGYAVLFLLLTSVGVGGIRSHFGITQSASSRYTIYSTLLLIFAWFIIVDEWLINKRKSLRRNRILVATGVIASLFSIAMDVWGVRFLARRNQDLITGMILYERHPLHKFTTGPIFPPPQSADGQLFNLRARDILAESAKLGIYRPPIYEQIGVKGELIGKNSPR